jgi:hypothetical protein
MTNRGIPTTATETSARATAWGASAAAGPWKESLRDSEFVRGQKSLQSPLGIFFTSAMVAIAAILIGSVIFLAV